MVLLEISPRRRSLFYAVYYSETSDWHLVYCALRTYGESSSSTSIGQFSRVWLFLGEMFRSVFLFTTPPRRSNEWVVYKLFTVNRTHHFSLDMGPNSPHYRASVTRAVKSPAPYSKYRFQTYDTPWWKFALDTIGLLRIVCYTGFI